MGNTSSKKPSVGIIKTPEKAAVTAIENSPTSHKASHALEPKTPAIPQTPLTQTIATHLNRIATDDQNQNIKTPSYLLRKKILYDLGYTYSIKETDPRSPSQCIPRTPLTTVEDATDSVIDSQASSFHYNSTLDESCRDFNAKLDEITIEEIDNEAEKNIQKDDNVENNQNDTDNSENILCAQKRPDDGIENTSNIGNHGDSEPQNKSTKVQNSNENIYKTIEESNEQMKNIESTPIMNKSFRSGRIPLSVINHRGMSLERTPLQNKNTSSATLKTEKQPKNLSFSSHDENRGSARKSKIPVFKK